MTATAPICENKAPAVFRNTLGAAVDGHGNCLHRRTNVDNSGPIVAPDGRRYRREVICADCLSAVGFHD